MAHFARSSRPDDLGSRRRARFPVARMLPLPPIPPGQRRSRCDTRRRLLVAGAAALLLAGQPLFADIVPLYNVELRIEDDQVLLNADFLLTLNPTLEEALQRGIPLYFVLEVDVVRPRWYWLDQKVASYSTEYRVSWQPLTRRYRVASGLLSQTYDTLPEVERLIGRVNARAIARASELERGVRHEAIVRLRLDANQLPKPFQVNALASPDWQLASEARRIAFTP